MLMRAVVVCVELDVKEEELETEPDQDSLGDPEELGVSYGDPLDDPEPEELLLEDGDGVGDTEGIELYVADPVESPVRVDDRVSRDVAVELLVADKLRDIVFGAE